jgi:rhodanese-related sulfurtransferase
MNDSISVLRFRHFQRQFPPPTLVDARDADAFARDPTTIPGALRRLPAEVEQWGGVLDPWRPAVIYCADGGAVSQRVAGALRSRGLDARILDGGIQAWRADGGNTVTYAPPSRWVTRERPKIDRIACPWLIRRFIDPAAEFFYVPNVEVAAFAAAHAATPYDVPDVAYAHAGAECSFDAFIRRHRLTDAPLLDLATIVRGADTAALHLSPQAPGLLAVSLGLSRLFADDHAMLRYGMLVYDALYAWCRAARGETHGWDPAALRAAASGR